LSARSLTPSHGRRPLDCSRRYAPRTASLAVRSGNGLPSPGSRALTIVLTRSWPRHSGV